MSSILDKLKILPMEVQNHILEFDPNHRQNMKKSLEKLGLVAIQKRTTSVMCRNKALRFGDDVYWNQIVSFLKANVDDPEIFIQHYDTCMCCKRHQKNRPKSVHNMNGTPHWGIYLDPKPISVRRTLCFCNCRHMSRNMYRAFHDEYFTYFDFDDEFNAE